LSVEHLTLQGTNIFIIVAVPLDLLHCVFNIHPTATLPYLYLSSTLHLGISMLPYPTFGQPFVFLLAGNLAISLFRLNHHQNQKNLLAINSDYLSNYLQAGLSDSGTVFIATQE
jgi:hypothetical protein